MTDGMTSASQFLEAEISAEGERIAVLQQELAEAQKRRRKRQQALRALQRLEDSTSHGATQDVVRPIAQEVLRDNETIEYDALYELVRGRLAGAGRPTSGLGLRMNELLRESWAVQVSPGVYSFSANEAAP